MTKKPDEALADLGELFRQRNAVYGDTYLDFGKLLMGLFPNGLTVSSEEEASRLAIVMHIADKLARYAKALNTGGHPDSLDDISVYAQLCQHADSLAREAAAERLRETF